ncbi:MAG: iron-sulfur protein [Omnitrophica bacterium RIFCSPLOWO2_12_FULL_44_17]|uniref:Iron-sulfur protein n=1 Tax=Candidatus Danuiimicrobium aquiferis TaxID=1801832 RepID=A0A1G1L1D4_9BACT|nr:MAG: iron-sulfur protein [Omnitrophica bacterium RIFCSPHIGHO2_02_FULL_45_28]OGW90006.1 MAG: iron-sulfur protein [Omnitrophica bacterium RIFCSPHIGHO2_12_FULL_44_12]OGW98970.1 MAG: iron-sulfur protein [Omnitrophica bacterium RIFCSPLOWO2_12_FULL_44_17]OGX01594.1 MAG: iron-sulfur protein [Omnitrophica bacterium RIFCSPLOWO2_02_FULL_44_11]
MKITIFNGSPRAEKGNTHWMVQEFMKGAESAGAIVENIFLAGKNIHHCQGCFTCWFKTPGKCTINDDMAELIEKFKLADILVFATPVYVDHVTGMMKDFLDRLVPLGDPHFEKDENGECRHVVKVGCEKPPKLVIISNCGFPEQTHFQVISHYFKRVARNMRTEVIGEIYRGGGEILREKSLLLMPFLYGYKKLLQKAGKEIVNDLKFSPETALKLEKPIVPDSEYIKSANQYWDSIVPKE